MLGQLGTRLMRAGESVERRDERERAAVAAELAEERARTAPGGPAGGRSRPDREAVMPEWPEIAPR